MSFILTAIQYITTHGQDITTVQGYQTPYVKTLTTQKMINKDKI